MLLSLLNIVLTTVRPSIRLSHTG